MEQEILDLEPEMDEQMELVLECWQKLDTHRPLGFGVAGAIPYLDVVAWCERQGADSELAQAVADVIRRLDVERSERISSELNHQ